MGTIVDSDPGADKGTVEDATVSCPAGKVLLGGGGAVSNDDHPEKSAMTKSFPDSTTQWHAQGVVLADLATGKKLSVQAWAICTA
jgi:hypothetical protein